MEYNTKELEISKEKLLKFLISEESHPFVGLDFSYIAGRMSTEPLGWNYKSKVLFKIRNTPNLLDIGTGCGDLLYSLSPLPNITYTIENIESDFVLAKRKLSPLGVNVIKTQNNMLPFENNLFNLILNRHSNYYPEEIYRVLKVGGQFVTQQIGGANDNDLRELLGLEDKYSSINYWRLNYAVERLENAGFVVKEKLEHYPITRFYDVGAIVFYLKVTNAIPDFTVNKYFDKLSELHFGILRNNYVEVRNHRFFIIAEKYYT